MNSSHPVSFTPIAGDTAQTQTHPHGNESGTLLFVLYAGIAAYQYLNAGVSYRSEVKLKTKSLPYHTVAGIVEVLLYYSGAQCSIISVLACLVHSITGLMLVNNLRKGYSVLTRPSYQAGSVLRPIVMIIAFFSGKRSHYHDALVPIHAFVYTRILFFLLGTIGPTTEFSKNVNSKYIYLLAIFGGAVIAVGHCHNVWAVPIYLLTLHAIGKLNFWTRTQVDFYGQNNQELPLIVRTLCKMSFCALPIKSDTAMQTEVNDGPKIGNLPADKLGHVWATKAVKE